MIRWKRAGGALALVAVLSCGGPSKGGVSEQGLMPVREDAGRLKAPGFSSVQGSIFEPRCVGCHAQYRSYEGVRRELKAIASAVEADRMPKSGGPLAEGLKELLRAWIAAGAPEVEGQPAPPDEPVDLRPQWKSISENIIFPRCLVCHNPSGQARFLDLSTRDAIVTAKDRRFGAGEGRKLIDFDSPGKSYLIEIVKDDVEPMPPAWSNIDRLTGNEIDALEAWVRAGIP